MNSLSRDVFDQEVDNSNIWPKDLFDIVNKYIANNIDDLNISLNDVIDYANIRREHWELAKAIYYCHYGLTQKPDNKSKIMLLDVTIKSLKTLINQDHFETVRSNDNININTSKNKQKIADLIQSNKIDSVVLTSYSARKQSNMSPITEWEFENIFFSYQKFKEGANYQAAFNDIYFLFSDSYLKEKITPNLKLLIEFQSFCEKWQSEIKKPSQ